MVCRPDLGLRDDRTLADVAQALVVLGGCGVYGAVVHTVESGDGGGDGRQDVALLHARLYASGDVFGEQHRGLVSGEELLHGVAACASDLDVEALELTLESIHALKGGTLVVFVGVERLKHLLKALASLGIHSLVQFYLVE